MLKLIFISFLLSIVEIFPQTLVLSHHEINTVEFLAKSTFSDFEGVTDAIDGTIRYDSNYTRNSEINFKVYLDSLDTGIGLRNKHMRSYLETNKYPLAKFDGKIVEADNLGTIETRVTVNGSLRIHGVEKQYILKGRIFNYGKLYKVNSSFKISLQDFDIDQPKFLFNKVDNEIKIELNIYFNRKD